MKKLFCLAALLCFSSAGCSSGITGSAEDRAKTAAGTTTGTMPAGGGSVSEAPKDAAGEAPKDAAGDAPKDAAGGEAAEAPK